ncbi:MAG: hypothetical protein JXA91_02355 [Candidatus Thermoplasmatota archaeon]|nr:hypothetical protein [Candidatus Thermoplasmatota archaeon]
MTTSVGVFLAQLVISMLRYKHDLLRHVSTKFIMQSPSNFALTIIVGKNGVKNRVFPILTGSIPWFFVEKHRDHRFFSLFR